MAKLFDKRAAYSVIELGYKYGFGPRRLAPLLGISPSYVRQIARDLGLPGLRKDGAPRPIPDEILALCAHFPVAKYHADS
jgi:hypothetical protein